MVRPANPLNVNQDDAAEGRHMGHEAETKGEAAVSGRFDRRDLIKKAAVAGGIAWVAPTVLASPAQAQVAACTPKCGPTNNGTFTGMVTTAACEEQNTSGPGSVTPNWHPAFFNIGPITNAGSGCGCGSSPVVTFQGLAQFHVGNNDWLHGTGNCMHIAYVGRHPSHPHINDPVGSPTYVTPIFANIRCTDRKGNGLCRTCEIYGTFCWTWMDGPRQCKSGPGCCENTNNGPFSITYTIKNCTQVLCCP
jgi:hypothetical protein